MKEKVINNDNLKEEEIDEYITRVKAVILNSNNEILLGYSRDVYQFPGGHLEKDETNEEGLKRELLEETGMNIETEHLKPYFLLKYYNKNYINSGKNRCNLIYYYFIKTDQKYDLNNVHYDEREIEGNYKLFYIPIDKCKETILNAQSSEPRTSLMKEEMIEALEICNLI